MYKSVFDNFSINDNKYQINAEKYLFSVREVPPNIIKEKESDEYLVYKKHEFVTEEPRFALWEYLTRSEVTVLLQLKKNDHVRKFIANKLKKPKGFVRIIFRELMYTVAKFCKVANFNLEQTGALMSQFYLTHLFFTRSLDVGPEKLYNHFKSLQMCHSLPFPPTCVKLFTLEESKSIMIYFCKIYLRNLPIIRLTSLPNFTLEANYHLEPELSGGKKKDKKDKKKGKKDKRKKK